jgi:hypothetical protein
MHLFHSMDLQLAIVFGKEDMRRLLSFLNMMVPIKMGENMHLNKQDSLRHVVEYLVGSLSVSINFTVTCE